MSADHRSDKQLVDYFDPFAGDKDGHGEDLPTRVVHRTRKVHRCNVTMEQHEIPVGSRALLYRFFDRDGQFVQFYCCAKCIDEWFTECRIDPDLVPAGGAA